MESLEFYQKRSMASRQGRAINHMYPTLFASHVKRPKTTSSDPPALYDFVTMLQDLETQRQQSLELSQQSTSATFTSSFKSVSREQHSFTTRNKTEAPKVGLYNPKWTAVKPRTSRAPRFKAKLSKTRDTNIFTPCCVEGDLNCTFPRRNSINKTKPEIENYDRRLKRSITKVKEYDKQVEQKAQIKTEIPKKAAKRIQSPIKFKNQLSRKPFVSESDPPNEKRFSFDVPISCVFSNNKKVPTFSFEKKQERKELFPVGLNLPPYERNEEVTMARVVLSVPDFEKMPDRKELVIEHMLATPMSAELNEYEDAFFKQSQVRGIHNLPSMATVTPRDDLMYRVKDTYNYNVPIIQTAEAKAKYQGETPISLLKEKFKMSAAS